MKLKIFALISIGLMLLLSACGGNKQIVEQEVVPVRNPLALAHAAAAEGAGAYEEKQFEEAITSFSEAIELFNEAAPTAVPSDSIALNVEKMKLNIAKSHIDLAMDSADDSMFDDAIESYEKALGIYKSISPVQKTQQEIDQDIQGVYNNLAITAKNAGKYEKALTYYDQLLKISPNDPELLNAKFFILSKNIGDEERAFTVLIDYAEASQDPDAFINLAEKYLEKGNTVAAGRYYQKALALKQDADMYRRMANFYRNTKDWENANIYLEKVVETKPENNELATIYTMIGKNYDELNNKKKMVEYYEKSLTLVRDPQIALALASYYNTQKNWAKVISNATITLSSNSNNTDALMLRGVAYYQSKNYKAARPDLEKIQNDGKYGAQVKTLLKNMPK